MKRNLNQFLAAVMLVFALSFSSCTKDSSTSSEPATVEATAIGSSAKSSTASSEAREYAFRDVEVELNDIGRKNLIDKGYSRMKQKADGGYVTDVNDPWEPYDPILCDGMTYSQVWADIMNQWNAFLNSPQGQAAQAYANSTCRPVYYCICNCALCVMFVLQPDKPCFELAEELAHTSVIKGQLIVSEAP